MHMLSNGLKQKSLKRSIPIHSPEQMISLGCELAKEFHPNNIIAFHGDLGSGKTTLIKGIVQGAAGIPCEQVMSPTFVYLNIYEPTEFGKQPVFHFDLYRLCDSDEFLSMGFEEYLSAQGICCIEWSERIAPLLPKNLITIAISYLSERSRMVEYEISKS